MYGVILGHIECYRRVPEGKAELSEYKDMKANVIGFSPQCSTHVHLANPTSRYSERDTPGAYLRNSFYLDLNMRIVALISFLGLDCSCGPTVGTTLRS